MNDTDLTPLMRQYTEIKKSYQDAIVFFRVGDFYEMFFDDAEEASKILNIALTSRDKHSPNPVPLCGVPYHAAASYIGKLLQHGRNVALCEQVEDPKLAKGLVKREVVRLFTPGTLIDPEFLESGSSNYLACVNGPPPSSPSHEPRFGLAVVDVSTGEFWCTELQGAQADLELFDELVKLSPQELLYREGCSTQTLSLLRGIKLPRMAAVSSSWFAQSEALSTLRTREQPACADDAPMTGSAIGLEAAGALYQYLKDSQPTISHEHLGPPVFRPSNQEMHLDGMTIRNLELVAPLSGDPESPTLLSTLDYTSTAMGRRLLRQWIVRPLMQKTAIQDRLDAVSELVDQLHVRSAVSQMLRTIHDIERISSRVSMASASPRECIALQHSLEVLPLLRAHLCTLQGSVFQDLCRKWDSLEDVASRIARAIVNPAPLTVREGGVIQDGYSAELDELRATARDGLQWIAELETRERRRSQIDSLKIKYNQVFGYYIEISKANLARVPADYVRKQTLANAERYTTEELKTLEERVTSAQSRLQHLEEELFTRFRQEIAAHTLRIRAMAKRIAFLDVLCGLAEAAARHRYTKPDVDEGGSIRIVDGRHPVIERMNLPGGYIPNDTTLNLDSHRVLIITGPNMAGKSTYLRQIALIVLMAQVGSFVPAREARIGVVDRVFTRVGASDNLVGGQSTFMVEMTETASILRSATQRSLILLDEIGRGTSTYDGLSLAWAIAEYIHDRTVLGSRTLFATHYHEMGALENLRDGIKNFTVAVREENGQILFLRKIIPGKADRSYGIHVAELAGLPELIILRAREILRQLEQSDEPRTVDDMVSSSRSSSTDHTIPQPHPILDEVQQMDLFSMTPLDAMNRLAELKARLQKEKR